MATVAVCLMVSPCLPTPNEVAREFAAQSKRAGYWWLWLTAERGGEWAVGGVEG